MLVDGFPQGIQVQRAAFANTNTLTNKIKEKTYRTSTLSKNSHKTKTNTDTVTNTNARGWFSTGEFKCIVQRKLQSYDATWKLNNILGQSRHFGIPAL